MTNPAKASEKLTELLPRWVKGLRTEGRVPMDPIASPGDLHPDEHSCCGLAAAVTPPTAEVSAATGQIFHIRAKVPPRGGNNFYRDRSERESVTLCGDAVTDSDVSFGARHRLVPWRDEKGNWHTPCPRCLVIRGRALTGEELQSRPAGAEATPTASTPARSKHPMKPKKRATA